MAASGLPAGELKKLYRLDDVSVRFRGRRDVGAAETQALDRVSLEVDHGELLVIMGASGSGKSTLLHIMAGLAKPDEGKVRFRASQSDGPDGRTMSLHTMSEDDCARMRRRYLGFVYQSFQLVETLTAWENIALPLLFGGVARDARRPQAEAMLDRVGLADRAERFPYELSGGEQQRVAIARALVNRPAVLLADEPTGSLDSASAALVLTLIKELHRDEKLTTVLVTHDGDVAKRMATRRIIVRDGSIVSEGTR
ncbi:MAG: putative transport system ATP-binding protein [Acidobacteriota bacterium]|jgi:putative ABC transport system ATP-binding protein|nr:putative transport system ATP-binding protein [Acidobacteriota bacterium]